MNFDLTQNQQMLRDTFARFFDEHSSMARVRAALSSGFDAALWRGLAELGAFTIRVPEGAGGLDLGLLDASVLMEEAGRTLVSGPLAETLVATRLLARTGAATNTAVLSRSMQGEAVLTIAFSDIGSTPVQWVPGGAIADAVIARKGDAIVLVSVPAAARKSEENLASTAIAEIDLGALSDELLSSGAAAVTMFEQAVEEYKLLMSSALSGLSREALRLAAAYASERKQFGVFIGTFQAVSHPLADLIVDTDGGKFLVWKAIRNIAENTTDAAATVSLAAWWNATTAAKVGAQALHTFGGYGLTTEYDIHLYNLRAKAWPLIIGDPQLLLEEAGRRLYGGERAPLPDVGEIPIDFDLGEDAQNIVRQIDDFFSANVTPAMRANFHYSWEGHNPKLHKQLADAGLAFASLPAEMGGRGLSAYARYAAAAALERQGYFNPAPSVAAMVAVIIYRFGGEDLKRDVLTRIMSGEAICSLGYSEPASGSDVFAAQCRATADGDGWRIDGTKMFTSGANLADYVLMLCRTNPDAPKHKGLTMFIVPLKSAGVTIQPVHTFQDERTNITFYDGVRIPDSWRLGKVDEGVRTMSASLELEHGGGFANVQHSMLRAAETLCREIRSNGCALIETNQAQARLARTAANVMVAELLSFRTMWVNTVGQANLAYGPMAKMFSSEKFLSDSRDLLDLTAPHSLSKRVGPAGFLNQSYRHAHGTTIYGGTSEIHRSMIAERTLGLPRTRV